MFVYTIQPVVKPVVNTVVKPVKSVWQPAVSCIQPVVNPVVQPGLTTVLNEQLFIQHRCQTGWTNTPFARYNRLSNRLYNRFDNRLYRVNKHPTGYQTGCQTGLTTDLTTGNRLSNSVGQLCWTNILFVQHGCQTCCTTRFDNRIGNCVERTATATVVKPGCTTVLTTGCIHDTAVCQTGCQTRLTTGLTTTLTTGWMFVYTIQPVNKRLYRVNGVLQLWLQNRSVCSEMLSSKWHASMIIRPAF